MMSRTALMSSLVAGGLALAATMTWPRPPAQAQQAAPPAADKAKARQASVDHVKFLMLAFHNAANANPEARFPASAIYGADGQPKLSWRVALLPYLEEAKLYGEFRQDEPWDGPHNKALIARMPDVFRTPHAPAPEGQTRFRGLMGQGAMFEGDRGVRISAITDGTANTVMIATAQEPVPWTKPDELSFAEGKPLPALENGDPEWSLAGMADGAALFVSLKDAMLLRAMITRNGGEVFRWPNQPYREPSAKVEGPDVLPAIRPTPSQPATSVEQRLQRLEEKLDRLMEKVDSLAGKKS